MQHMQLVLYSRQRKRHSTKQIINLNKDGGGGGVYWKALTLVTT